MLYRLVRPMKRSGSSIPQFVQRIPADLKARAVGRALVIPRGNGSVTVRIGERTTAIRFSLGSRDPAEIKARQAEAAACIERVWQALRRDQPVVLANRDAHALAGELYRAWADGQRERVISVELPFDGCGPVRVERPHEVPPKEAEAGFAAASRRLAEEAERGGLEAVLGPVADRLLLRRGIAAVAPESRELLLSALLQALKDAFANRVRNAAGDFTPDPKAARFPEWSGPDDHGKARSSGTSVTITGLVEAWWSEAKARGLKPSTYESYRNTASGFVALLGHDDATRVTPEDVLRFKDHRLASVHPRTGKTISAKTVKDSDLAGLKAIFGWALANRKLPSNPAAGITIKVGKALKLRSKGFTDAEAKAILSAATAYRPNGGNERPETTAAKRWVPWLCAYTGARVGEMVQLRKQDVRQDGDLWVIRITPEAGTVKTNEAREVVLHPHLVEQGFPGFVAGTPSGHLFLKPNDGPQRRGNVKDGRGVTRRRGDRILGPAQGVKNRLQEFVRAIVPDPNVAPNHGWRHRFKTVGMEAGIAPRILDAIQGQAPASIADSYGEVTLKTQAEAIARLPRIKV